MLQHLSEFTNAVMILKLKSRCDNICLFNNYFYGVDFKRFALSFYEVADDHEMLQDKQQEIGALLDQVQELSIELEAREEDKKELETRLAEFEKQHIEKVHITVSVFVCLSMIDSFSYLSSCSSVGSIWISITYPD